MTDDAPPPPTGFEDLPNLALSQIMRSLRNPMDRLSLSIASPSVHRLCSGPHAEIGILGRLIIMPSPSSTQLRIPPPVVLKAIHLDHCIGEPPVSLSSPKSVLNNPHYMAVCSRIASIFLDISQSINQYTHSQSLQAFIFASSSTIGPPPSPSSTASRRSTSSGRTPAHSPPSRSSSGPLSTNRVEFHSSSASSKPSSPASRAHSRSPSGI